MPRRRAAAKKALFNHNPPPEEDDDDNAAAAAAAAHDPAFVVSMASISSLFFIVGSDSVLAFWGLMLGMAMLIWVVSCVFLSFFVGAIECVLIADWCWH